MSVVIVNDSGFKFGCLPGRVPPRALTGTFILKGTFDLIDGRPAKPLPLDDQFNLNGDTHFGDDPLRSIRSPSDFALFKPHAEYLLSGHACAPRGKTVNQMLVAVEIGSKRKELAAFGDRIWKPGLLSSSISDPQRFERMPLDWEHALGSPNNKRNPLGRGLEPRPVEGVGMVHLAANIENPRHIIRSPSSRDEPVGFLPIDPLWPQRASKVGTYGGKWVRDRWPWMPDDFDWTFFNSAPADQQLEGFLRGDEKLVLEGMHPDKPRQEFELPKLKPRWFVREKGKDGKPGPLSEVPLQLDTLWVDADENKLVLTWRGLREIKSIKMREIVEHFMLSEPLAEPAHDLAYYEALCLRRRAEIAKEEDELEPGIPDFTVEDAELPDSSWVQPFEKQFAALEKEAAAGGPAKDLAQMERHIKQQANWPATLKSLKPVAALPPHLADEQAALKQADQTVKKLLSPNAYSKLPKGGPAEMLKSHAAQGAAIEKDVAAAHAKFPATQPPKDGAAPEAEDDADEPAWTRERVVSHARDKGKFADVDLSFLDLTGLDLSGADFAQCVMAGTILKQAVLNKARFAQAVLEKADLSEAQCREADFTNADCTGANFTLAVLEGALLADADCNHAKFSGAKLSRANASNADFTESDFTQVSAEGANFTYANLTQAQAPKAKFSGSNLTDADFDSAKAGFADFSSCNLTRFRGSKGDFSDAKFTQAQGDEPALDEANLERADFSQARLPRAAFTASSLKFARLEGGSFKESQFDEAAMEGSFCAKANFFKATFETANLLGADFQGANLYGCEFWQCVIDGAKFDQADLKGSKLA